MINETEIFDVIDDSNYEPITVIVRDNNNKEIGIVAKDYGLKNIPDGEGEVAIIENRGGTLFLIVWADINREDPTHIIDLSGAKISNRKED